MSIRHTFNCGFCCTFGLLGMTLLPVAHAHAAQQHPLAALKYFIGEWACAGHFANGKPVQSHDTISAELEGHWLRVQHIEDPPAGWRADEWWGYDKAAKQFTVTLFDNYADERHYVSSGWIGNALTLENTAVKGFNDRFVFERQNGAEYRVVYSYRKDTAPWHVGDEQVCTRE